MPAGQDSIYEPSQNLTVFSAVWQQKDKYLNQKDKYLNEDNIEWMNSVG